MAQIVVKVRVVDLSEIPWFIVCSKREDFEGDSYIAQCEILQYRMLGGGHGEEEEPPDDVDPNLFDFLVYGQPSSAGYVDDEHNNNQNANHGPTTQWGILPNGPEAQEDVAFIGPQVNPEGPPLPNDPLTQPAPDLVNPIVNDFLEANDLAPNGNALDFDLNMVVEEDLGGIEDLIQAAANLKPKIHVEEEHIIDGTKSSDSSMGNAPI